MLQLDVSFIAKILNAKLEGNDANVCGLSIDSRTVQPGNLFFAIPGERADPHQFLNDVLAKGAGAAVVERLQPVAIPQLVVEDSFKALGQLASYWRDQFALPMIALTGSNGKTTLKNMIASILLAHHRFDETKVLYTHGNYNSGFGLPLTLSRLSATHQVGVLEMGMSSLGEIDYITRIAKPKVAIINNVACAHVEFLGSVENVAKAKGEIFHGLSSNGIAVLNRDDDFYDYWKTETQAFKTLTFGLHPNATVYATNISDHIFPSFTLCTPLGNAKVQLNYMGKHNVRNALAATAACMALAIPLESIVSGLEHAEPVPGRLREVRLDNGITLLDDSYNANPGSMQAGIDVLEKYPGRKILVMGDMRELGSEEIALHRQIGYYATDAGVDHLLAIGGLAAEAADTFQGDAQHFEDHDSLLNALKPLLEPGSTFLVKGSFVMGMTKIVKAFTEPQPEPLS